ncbi:MAG: aldo/keto reductase [Tagaea sp.]|nr:aldo/keto reductase [Tagaea sp.]
MTDPILPTRPLGRTGLKLTQIGFGAGPLGGFADGFYGAISEDAAVAAVDAAWDAGIRYFDVAPLYGHGRSELILGRALRARPRDEFVISTKVGRHLVPPRNLDEAARIRPGGLPFVPVFDYSREGTMRSLEQSMARLGLPRIDIVLIHDVDAHAQVSQEAAESAFALAMEGALPALRDLKRAGRIDAIGIGVNQVDWALRWLEAADIDCCMIAGRCTLLNRDALPKLLPECAARGIGVLAGGAFNGGLLARRDGSQGPKPYFNYRPVPDEVMARLDGLKALAASNGVDLTAAAIQYVLRQPGISSLVMGMMRPSEIRENVEALRVEIPGGFWDTLI